MTQMTSLIVYIESQMCKLSIRMHFDQFDAVQKKNSISLPPTVFSALPHHAHFQTKHIDKPMAFFKYTGIYFLTKYTLNKSYKRIK